MEYDVVFGIQKGAHQDDQPFGLFRADRRHHCYAVGRTGMGKSTLLFNSLVQDIHAGEGVALLDPHGDLAEKLLDHIPEDRIDDVVYFNPADIQHPSGLNVLEVGQNEDPQLVVSGVIAAFKHLWRDSWGPRLEYILSNTLQTAVALEYPTLLTVYRALQDETFREGIVRRTHDPVLRHFWEEEFSGYGKRSLQS